MAIADHYAGLCRAAIGLGVRPDILEPVSSDHAARVGLVMDQDADARTGAIFDAIREREREWSGLERVPNFWRALANHFHYLRAAWEKEQVVMCPGELDLRTKAPVAFAVAIQQGAPYFTDYHTLVLKRLGFNDPALVEMVGWVNSITTRNAISHLMQLESRD
ncbi:MAG: hypothetical protein HYY05_03325 [Chloroflexi bacterium]|nr:hypothetical protein [Chloroflexota bacterium]